MNIGDLLTNDEHTSVDGAYSRVLKARRWLYVVAVVATLEAHNLVDYVALSRIFGNIIIFQHSFARATIILALALLSGQFILLLFQLSLSYRKIIAERIIKKAEESLADAVHSMKSAATNLESLSSTLAAEEVLLQQQKAEFKAAQERIKFLQDEGPKQTNRDNNSTPPVFGEVVVLSERSRRIKDNIKSQEEHNERRRGEIDVARENYNEQIRNLAIATQRTPEANPAFRFTEYAIDSLRFGPPILFALYGLLALMGYLKVA